MHDWRVPGFLTFLYLLSLPSLKWLSQYIPNPKSLLQETMVLYNAGQVALNGWTVYVIVDALINKGHPAVGSVEATTCTFAVWVHYCDKYLEFFDTWFMLLRGRLDQVSFLHVYHHTTIAWAWWAGMTLYPNGDAYFGALLNSAIHVLMYGYYTLALLGIPCPWKRYLTMAQLAQFASVMVYTAACFYYNHQQGQLTWRHVLACAIQVGEMASLFALFFGFYKKSYTKRDKSGAKKKNDELEIDDECNAAIKETVTGQVQDECAAAIGSFVAPVRVAVLGSPAAVSKISSKISQEAERRSPGVAGRASNASKRPSWGLAGN